MQRFVGKEHNWLGIEQRFCLFEIGRVETLRKPAVDGRKKVPSLTAPSLIGQQASEASGGAQFPRSCALLAGDCEGSPEAFFGISDCRRLQ
jgi:hypothetical protein